MEYVARNAEEQQRRERRDQGNQAEGQVLGGEWVARLIVDAEEREERIKQEHIARTTQNDEQPGGASHFLGAAESGE